MRSITSSVRSLATDLVCPRCSRRFAGADARELTCVCGGPLFQEYATKKWSEPDAGALRDEAFGTWRYKRFLPVRDSRHIVTLGEGGTPLVNLDRSAEELGLGGLQVKDEGQNPTGTFKVRGASVAISRLLELGYRSIAMPTVGSGGSAWAAYAGRAGLKIAVGFPTQPAVAAIGPFESKAYGADVSFHPGDTESAFRSFRDRSKTDGAIYVGAFREPYRLEGEKTIGYEIAEQFGWSAPDWIAWPTGGAVGFVGLAKAFQELEGAGLLRRKLPGLLAVQHVSAGPIAGAVQRGDMHVVPAGPPAGIAPGLWVGNPFAADVILKKVQVHELLGEVVTDDSILRWMRVASRREGLLMGPEGAAALAGVEQAVARGAIPRDAKVVVVNTSSGLRYPHLVEIL